MITSKPDTKEILIVGAGSTGLSAALFLADLGYKPRIIDKRTEPATITKALGVNANTLKLLEKSGVTDRFLKNGWKNSCMNFWSKGRIVYKNDFSHVKHPYPFMLIQPQFETEQIIEEALGERNIFVERDLTLDQLDARQNSTHVAFKNHSGGMVQTKFDGIILGADGNKSKVRECINTPFKGWEHSDQFRLYDVELETPVTHLEGHYFFFKEGGMIMLHIRDGMWRIGGNLKDTFNYLPLGTKVGKISWDASFTVREKVADTFNVNNVFLLGDAAHIHSPAGAKGMNLCIEDSYIFSKLFHENRHKQYNKVRHAKIKNTVGILGQLTDKVGGHNFIGSTIRTQLPLLSVFFPLVMPRMNKFLLGLT